MSKTKKSKLSAKPAGRLQGLLAVNWAQVAQTAFNYGEKSVATLKKQAKTLKKTVETQISGLNLPWDRAMLQSTLKRVQNELRSKAAVFLYLPTLHTVRKLEKKLTHLERQLQKKSAKPHTRRAA